MVNWLRGMTVFNESSANDLNPTEDLATTATATSASASSTSASASSSTQPTNTPSGNNSNRLVAVGAGVGVTLGVGVIALGLLAIFLWRKQKRKTKPSVLPSTDQNQSTVNEPRPQEHFGGEGNGFYEMHSGPAGTELPVSKRDRSRELPLSFPASR